MRETVERCKDRERNGGTQAMLARVETMTKVALEQRAEAEQRRGQGAGAKPYQQRLDSEVTSYPNSLKLRCWILHSLIEVVAKSSPGCTTLPSKTASAFEHKPLS